MAAEARTFDRAAVPVAAWVSLLVALENARPLRERTQPRVRRWRANALLGALASAVIRGAVLPAMLATARTFQRRGLASRLPPALRTPVELLLLDAAQWGWHRANHAAPLLWRFHEQHHTDPDLDASTALRFHVGELALSIPVRCAIVALLGVRPRSVVTYELAMVAAATFHHANLRLPDATDRALSSVVVTPRMHGVHHHAHVDHLASNWGVVLSVWDRLAGTFVPAIPGDGVPIGVPDAPDPSRTTHAPSVLRAAFARR